jgi:hypothetical protein
MKTIRIDELESSGFSEDPEGLREFQRRQVRPVALAAAAFVASLVLGAIALVKGFPARGIVVAAIVCWVVIWITIIVAYLRHPKSRNTGKTLDKYRRLSSQPGYLETVYVDSDSKTYFVQGFGGPGQTL